MLRLNIVQHNPEVANLVTSFGFVLLALVAALTLALWIVVARGRARRDIQDFDASDADSGLEALRHERLVVRPSATPAEPQAAVVAELEPTGESDSAGR